MEARKEKCPAVVADDVPGGNEDNLHDTADEAVSQEVARIQSLGPDVVPTLAPDKIKHVTTAQLRAMGWKGFNRLSEEQKEAVKPIRAKMQAEARENARIERGRKKDEALEDLEAFSIDDEILDEEPDGTDWLVEGWFPRGYVSFVYGDSKCGKSTFARALALGLSRGESPFPSIPIHEPQAGIFLTGEDRRTEFLDGMREQAALIPGTRLADLQAVYFTEPLLREKTADDDEDTESISEYSPGEKFDALHRAFCYGDFRYLIVDHLSRFARNFKLQNDDATRPFMHALCEFAESYNVAVIVLHHSRDTNKGYQNRTGMLGGSVLKHEARSIVRVEKGRNGTARIVHESINYGADESTGKPPVLLERVNGAFREAPSAREHERADAIVPQVVQWLTDNPEALITLGGLRQARDDEPKALVQHVAESVPGADKREVADAVEAAIGGTLAVRMARKGKRDSKVLTLPESTTEP